MPNSKSSNAAPNHRLGIMPDPSRISDGGKSAALMYAALDAEYHEARKRRRIEYIMSRLTMKQHELYCLMAANLTQVQIAAELGVSREAVSQREAALVKKIRRLIANTGFVS